MSTPDLLRAVSKNRRRSPNRASFRCSFLKIQKANELRKKQPFVLISCEKSRFMQTIVFIYGQKRSERFHFRSERFCFLFFFSKHFFCRSLRDALD
ncbi:MAG: hypothetical protein J6W28_00480, partial [Clostridia bacterium]|nr:hypothetical protein [Clostridia bacterium]